MPPVDYAQYRKVMPSGGVASIIASAVPGPIFLTDANGISYDAAGNIVQGPSTVPVMSPSEAAAAGAAESAQRQRNFAAEMQDPNFAALVAEQKATNEPWSNYLGQVASNAGNTISAFLPTALGGRGEVGVSDIAKGAVQSAYSGATLPGDAFTGRIEAFDPATGRPTEELIARGTDFTGMMTLGAGAIPAEANSLRMGMTALTGHPKNPEGSVRKAEIRSGGLYSKAEDVLQNWDQKEGTFEQFKAYLKKAGVKQPEIEALTKNYNPGDRVNKQQLINTLMAEEPEIKVVETNYFGDDGYNMPGGTNYRMMNITWDNPSPTYGMHPYRYTLHNLPDNTLVHARLKDDVYTGADGVDKKVLRVEELQSDWAQQGEGKFALPVSADRVNVRAVPLDQVEELLVQSKKKEIAEKPELEARYRKLGNALADSAAKEGHDTFSFYRVSGVKSTEWQAAGAGKQTPENILESMADFEQELDRAGTMAEPMDPVQEMQYNARFGQEPAPYVAQGSSGVLPMAVKRLLVEAAENGQDEIVFAPGAVHARRWASSDPERAAGLKGFYDSLLPKEVGKVLKDVEKDSGIKGIELTKEERPFIDDGASAGSYTAEYEPTLWTHRLWGDRDKQEALGLNPPTAPNRDAYTDLDKYYEDRDNYGAALTAYENKLNIVQNQMGTIDYYMKTQGRSLDEAVTEMAKTQQGLIDSDNYLTSSYQSVIDELENRPYNQLTRADEIKLQDARDNLEKFTEYRREREERMATLQDTHRLYKYWMDNIKAKPETKEAFVIKLTPDLREYIKKNGLPRFAKGGIVDLATHAARAGNIHGALA